MRSGLALPAQRRVHEASDGRAGGEEAITTLHAANAGANLVQHAVDHLARQLGIGDQRAAEGDEVGLAGGERLLAERRRHAADGDHRHGDGLLHDSGERQ